MGLSQMGGFFTLLAASVLFFALTSMFGGDGDADTDGGIAHGENGPGLLSLRNLFLFGVGFGAAGAITTHLGFSLMYASVAGCFAGGVFALLGWGFYRTIGKQQASTNVSTTNLVGKKASVSTAILSGRVGQIVTKDEYGSTIYLDARGSDNSSFNQGEAVTIVDASGNFATVAKQH